MKRRIFLPLVLLLTPLVAIASTTRQELNDIQTAVQQAASHHLASIYGKQSLGNDVLFSVANLDHRLQLQSCELPLQTELKEASYSARTLSVKVSCPSGARWSIYVPVNIDIYADVAVSARSLHRGDIVQAGDYVFKRTNTSMIAQGYLDNPAQVVGMEIRRSVRTGSVIKKHDLKRPNLIVKGETVMIIASAGALEVKSEAKALNNGTFGQQIKVQNLKSRRIVEARVTGPGIAEIAL